MPYNNRIEKLKAQGRYRTLPVVDVQGKYVFVNGKRLLNLSGNDYLGLLDLPELRDSFKEVEADYALSSCSSRLLTGNTIAHRELEDELRSFYDVPSVLCFDSGFHANIGILPALCTQKSLILADKFVHASIIDGIQLSGTDFRRFRHNSMDHLERLYLKNHEAYDEVWVVVESIYSMDGDRAPLEELLAFKKRFPKVKLYIDEAHAVGCLGSGGRGLVADLKAVNEVDVLLGTMGKALCSVGAYAITSPECREVLVSTARPLIFSTSLPPISMAWSRHIIRHLPSLEPRRTHLAQLVSRLREKTSLPVASHIVPILTGTEQAAIHLSNVLIEHGYYALPIRRPTVPPGGERVRLSLTAALTFEEIDRLADLLNDFLEQKDK